MLNHDKFAEFKIKANIKHKSKYLYPDQDFKNNYTKIRIICPKHGEFLQKPNYHLSGGGCKKCAIEKDIVRKTLSQDEFIEKCKKVHPEYNYSSIIYKGTHYPVKVICLDHGEFVILASNLLAGHGCPRCYARSPTKESFIEAAKSIHGDRYDYSKVQYKNNLTKVEIICSKHGSFYITPGNHLEGKGCPKCNSSKGEKKIRELLTKYTINFIEQKRFSDCRDKHTLPFDFYLPDYDICIEYQGEQHYIPVRRGYMTDNDALIQLQNVQRRDNIKRKYCINNSIRLIEISYKDDINECINKLIASF